MVDRRREGRVDDDLDAAGVGGLREGGDVDHAQVGIRRRLGEEELRVRADRGFEGGEVARLDHRRLDAHAREELVDELARAAIAIARHDQMAALRQQRHEGRRRRAHARREEDRLLAALERRDLALDRAPGRVAVAPVLLALALALLVVGDLLRVAEPEGRGLVDRRGDRVGFLLAQLARVDGARGAPAIARFLRQLGHGSSPPAREARVDDVLAWRISRLLTNLCTNFRVALDDLPIAEDRWRDSIGTGDRGRALSNSAGALACLAGRVRGSASA